MGFRLHDFASEICTLGVATPGEKILLQPSGFSSLAGVEADEEQLQYQLQQKVGVAIAIKRQQNCERNDVCDMRFY